MENRIKGLENFEKIFEIANKNLHLGRYREAKQGYEKAYAMQPNWRTAYSLGLACAHLGQHADAIRFYYEATLHDPMAIEPRVNLANIQRDLGEHAEARFHHLVAYSINPNHSLTNYNVSLAMSHIGESILARELMKRCLGIDPTFKEALSDLLTLSDEIYFTTSRPLNQEDAKTYAEAIALGPERATEAIMILEEMIKGGARYAPLMVDLGNLYLAMQRTDDAIAMQKSAIECDRLLAPAYHNLGAAEERLNVQAAISSYERSLALAPQLAQTWMNLGRLLMQQGRLDRASDCFLRAECLAPDMADATIEFANVAQKLRRTNDVIAAMQRLQTRHPDNFMVSNNLGVMYLDLGRLDEALACFENANRINSESAMVVSNIGAVAELRGQYREALNRYKQAREMMPDSSSILARVLHVSQHQCEWDGIDQLFKETIRLVREGKFEGVNPFSLITVPGIDRIDQLNCAKAFCEDRLGYLKPMVLPPVAPSLRRGSRIKIGYASSDLYDHATSWLIAEVIELHDRSKFEIVAYSYGPSPETPTRARLRKSFDRFVDVHEISDEQAAHMIRSDEIDILVDLKGYTQNCRTGIFALRPAPVQINYLGFPGTLGAEFIEYMIADDITIPESYEDGYIERILKLPGCYQPNDRQRALPPAPSRAEAGLPAEGFVFCSFNNVYKIIPDVFDVWCRLLKETDGSVLWILCSNPDAFHNLQKEAQARGVDANRLILAPRVLLADHIARFRCADLFLDTFPCAAHTTASDALWAGVPVVTMVGDTFASRVAASLLEAVDLPELIAENLEEYYEIARKISSDPASAAALKTKLEAERETSLLFDSRSYTRDLEAAYIAAFENWRRQETSI